MSTFTASELTSAVRSVHAGLQAKSSRLDVAVTGTASSVVYLAKVPHGATIVDFIFYVDDGGADDTWKLGLQLPHAEAGGSNTFTVTESALMTETASTLGPTLRPVGGKLPYRVSISDNVAQRWAWIQAVNTVAISASAAFRFTVVYQMDENT